MLFAYCTGGSSFPLFIILLGRRCAVTLLPGGYLPLCVFPSGCLHCTGASFTLAACALRLCIRPDGYWSIDILPLCSPCSTDDGGFRPFCPLCSTVLSSFRPFYTLRSSLVLASLHRSGLSRGSRQQ